MRLSVLVGILLCALGAARAQDVPTSPVVTVNGETITRGDIGMRVLARLLGEGKSLETAQKEGEIERLAPGVTTELIVEKLLDQSAKKEGIVPTEEEIEAGLKEFQKSVPEGISYSEYLRSYGTTEPIVREDIARNLRVKQFIEKATSKLEQPDEATLQAAYSKNRSTLKADVLQARHIVTGTRAEAEAVRKRVTGEGAEDFAAVAKEVSLGATAARGGALSAFPRGFLDPAFDEVAFALKPGEVGEIVETSAGFHVIKLEGVQKDAPLTFETAEPRLRAAILGRKHNAFVHRLIYELRNAADLEWAPGVSPPVAETGGSPE